MDWPLTVLLGWPLSDTWHPARELPETGQRITACAVVLDYRDAVVDDTGKYRPSPFTICSRCQTVLESVADQPVGTASGGEA